MTNQLDPADPGSNLSFAKTIGAIGAQATNVNVVLGIVISFNAALLQVSVSGSTVLQDAAYLLSPHYRPAVGDTVVLLRYGGSWLCLGATSLPPSDNLVVNGSFEIAPNPGDPPSNWTLKTLQTGANAPSNVGQQHVNIAGGEIDGQWVLGMTIISPATGNLMQSEWYFYSDPIPVIPGEVYAGYGYFRTTWDNSNAPLSSLETCIFLGTYPDKSTTTPTTMLAGNTLQGWTTVDWNQIMIVTPPNGVVIPSGTNYIRVLLYNFVTVPPEAPASTQAFLSWDRIVLRKIYNADGSLAVVPSA